MARRTVLWATKLLTFTEQQLSGCSGGRAQAAAAGQSGSGAAAMAAVVTGAAGHVALLSSSVPAFTKEVPGCTKPLEPMICADVMGEIHRWLFSPLCHACSVFEIR